MKKKYAMTLLEIMIVIFIIGIIGSVMGYNMSGSLDNGKAFKTKEGCRKLYEIIQLEMTQTGMPEDKEKLLKEISKILDKSGLVRNVQELMKDGWGNEYQFEMKDGKLKFHSEKYEAYCKKKKINEEYPWQDEEKDKEDLSHS
ncbi:MAG: prepilin-type N-terminal cleavage/methylation domain-containing protein [Simkaniaceae bacterium]|nr:prepilin-type N-terminal cleavage/methylation domain-containing protein [Simkaniaceae bacterium]